MCLGRFAYFWVYFYLNENAESIIYFYISKNAASLFAVFNGSWCDFKCESMEFKPRLGCHTVV
jgi:hypothetical protein